MKDNYIEWCVFEVMKKGDGEVENDLNEEDN
jgi:hypothetical protein